MKSIISGYKYTVKYEKKLLIDLYLTVGKSFYPSLKNSYFHSVLLKALKSSNQSFDISFSFIRHEDIEVLFREKEKEDNVHVFLQIFLY